EDAEKEEMKKWIREMQEEAEKIKKIKSEEAKRMNDTPSTWSAMVALPTSLPETDSRSIWIGNLDQETTVEELNERFKNCGAISRTTIPCDKLSGKSKGFAYIEFLDADSVGLAMTFNYSVLRGRKIKV
ncbi:hypothetical protein HELRODRAFT_125265, partial [Helobdella robusta]|uniref:RRM domain-containing protein n=1 Tax=Helobdella robusta TaxID=6412 RepID=T1EH53_HELRO